MGLAAISPFGPNDAATVTTTSLHSQPTQLKSCKRRGFFLLYGWSGVLMIIMFLLSGSWTLALAVIQLFPTETANYIMRTTELDYGDFWILSKAENSIAVPSSAALVGFAIAYLWLVVLMTIGRRPQTRPIRQVNVVEPPSAVCVEAAQNRQPQRKVWYKVWLVFNRIVRYSIFQDDVLFLALPKLMLQSTKLIRYLRDGFPEAITLSYSTLLLLNWVTTSYRIVRRQEDARYVMVRIFYSFDSFFAVFAPLQVLLFAAHNFTFNRDEFRTRIESFPSSNFDRTARLFADPTQVSLFRIAFQSLQLMTFTELGVMCALNAFAIRKWKRMINKLNTSSLASPNSSSLCQPTSKWLTDLLSMVIFACGASIFIYSIVAVTSTKKLCRPFPECKVPSYKWNVGTHHCSCVVFVNRFTRIKTYNEWLHPEDTTESLTKLSATGDLKIVQIVNRQLPTLPDEMRRCTSLMQLVLLYTKITQLPDWTKDFSKMEYFHIQGDFTAKQLASLPENLLLSMRRLRFLYFGTLPNVPAIPRLSSLSSLKYLMLALMHSITSIPSFDGLMSLQQLTIIDAIRVDTLPSTKDLKQLKMFSLDGRNVMCCNGFVDGVCNLKHFACLDRTKLGEPPVLCTTHRMDLREYASLSRMDGVFCSNDQTFDIKDTRPTQYSIDVLCGGVMYKRCTVGSAVGICFPSRMMPISCQILSLYQDMRRLQIKLKVGDACDPEVEAWLGCTS